MSTKRFIELSRKKEKIRALEGYLPSKKPAPFRFRVKSTGNGTASQGDEGGDNVLESSMLNDQRPLL